MRVLHISHSDIVGGAARASYRLHLGLQRLKCDSRMLVSRRRSADPAVTLFVPPSGVVRRIARWVRAKRIAHAFKTYRFNPRGYDFFSDARSRFADETLPFIADCDIVNLHWVANFIDYEAVLPPLFQQAPVVWTLHDMNIFTGGCHYDKNCRRYVEQCGACPKLNSSDDGDLSHEIWQRKHRVFAQCPPNRLHFVADSEWLAGEARRSSLLKQFPISTIHYGLDTENFAPRDRMQSRQILGLPADSRVILFAAASVNDGRKGFKQLVEATTALTLPNVTLVSIGHGEGSKDLPVRSLHLGHIDNDRLLSMIYSAADVFVIPSLQEAFGQTALEAAACGLPSVGFNTGGIPDIVRPGVTGLLASVGNVTELREATERILKDEAMRQRLGTEARKIVLQEFTLEIQARHYLELYERMLAAV